MMSSNNKSNQHFLSQVIGLPGPSSFLEKLPKNCPLCDCKDFYKQSDFRRSIGLTLVAIASVATFVLMYMGYNWFVVWSPMPLFLVFDRALYYLRPPILICYKCKHNFRGLTEKDLESIEAFDLETHDRYEFQEEFKKNK
jgi:glutaredoxin